MTYRHASVFDIKLLARLNSQLIEDQNHRGRLSLQDLEKLWRGWLAKDYKAVLFEQNSHVVAYALYRPGESHEPSEANIYLRQFFVSREHRRQGVGCEAMKLLVEKIWPRGARVTVEVLAANDRAQGFFRSIGFSDYAITMEYSG